MSVPSVVLAEGRSNGLGFSVPVDDTHSRILFTGRMRPDVDRRAGTGLAKMKPWSEMTFEERQDTPGDYEAQVGQGPISLHSEEHLATSDRGIAMQRRMLSINDELRAEGFPEIGVGIGLHTGEVIVGYIGSERRSEYTAIGDTVNTASRLESNAKAGEILVSEVTAKDARTRYQLNPRDPISVKNRVQPVPLFEVDWQHSVSNA